MIYSSASQGEHVNRDVPSPVPAAPAAPIFFFVLFGFAISVFTFFPGWMSND